MNKEKVESIYRLSPVQQGMLFHTLYAPGEGVYFEQFEIDFAEGLDPAAFTRAWQDLVDRNPALRTSFVWEGLEEPVQVVHKRVSLPVLSLDWRGIPAEEQTERLREHRAGERRRGFDLRAAPLMRFSIVRLGEDHYRVVWHYSHLVLDGWSVGLLIQEVNALYFSTVAGRPLQVQERRPFRDYIAWLRQQDLARAKGYWRRVLGGFTTPTPLGIDRPAGRGRGDLGRGTRVALVPAAETEALKAWARQSRLTLSTAAQGAWALLLSRYSGGEDVVFGLTVSGRPPGLPGVDTMLGCFINTLPVRARVPAGERVSSWLQGLQAEQNELRQHEHSPLVQVLGWSEVPRPAPLFESIFVFEGFVQTAGESAFQRTNYPLTLVVGPDREMVLRVDYERERFEAAAVERLLGHLKSALLAFAADPDRRLGEIDVLQPAERNQLLSEWNRPEVRFESPLCLHQIFESQAARTPGAPAVTFEGESRTYGELNARANRVAHRLRRLGVGPESRVGLCVDRSFELVEGLLGILKAGGAYVPLDPRYPSSRLSYIAEDSGIEVVVTTEDLRELVPGVAAVCLSETSEESAENPEPVAGPDNLAYVIYTSGSTGKPKGVMIAHACVARLLKATEAWFNFSSDDVWTLFHSYAFDFSVWEIWGALAYGGRIVVVPSPVSRAPDAFYALLC
ncbi:MAG: condensation domain-containing protein, partial [Thermoanaerobaculia bacterium]